MPQTADTWIVSLVSEPRQIVSSACLPLTYRRLSCALDRFDSLTIASFHGVPQRRIRLHFPKSFPPPNSSFLSARCQQAILAAKGESLCLAPLLAAEDVAGANAIS